MSPLHRAVALVQVHGVTVGIGQHLHFDVLGAVDVFFDEDIAATKGALGFALGLGQRRDKLGLAVTDAHAAPPPPNAALTMTG